MRTLDPRRVPSDVLIAMRGAGEFVISNVATRTHALGNLAFLELLSSPASTPTAEILVRDVSRSPFTDGLLGDPTGMDRAAEGLGDVRPASTTDALSLARRLKLIIDDLDAYRAYLSRPRLSVLDNTHRGTIHQCVGEHVLLGLRERNTDAWWLRQKFTDDLREPRPGPYREVQWPFAVAHYARAGLAGENVLDFGCGPGLFARLFARNGANVLALDTNIDHLETARRLAMADGLEHACEFFELKLPLAEGLAPFAGRRFDRIFLSDVLMFYFHPYDNSLSLDPVELIRRLAAMLTPQGRIEILEPNGIFWQQPWLGEPDHPCMIVTEYRHKRYGVTPTLEQISRVAETAGLAITRVRELVPQSPDGDPSMTGFAEKSPLAGYAEEFPLWWFFELKRSI